MRYIRALIYKVGIRPKPGSIFFSPSRALSLAMKEALPQRVEEALAGLDKAELADYDRSKGYHNPTPAPAKRPDAMCPERGLHREHTFTKVTADVMVAGYLPAHCPGVSEKECGLDTYHHEHFWGYPFDTQHRCAGHIRPGVPAPNARCPLMAAHPTHLWVPSPGQPNHCCSGA